MYVFKSLQADAIRIYHYHHRDIPFWSIGKKMQMACNITDRLRIQRRVTTKQMLKGHGSHFPAFYSWLHRSIDRSISRMQRKLIPTRSDPDPSSHQPDGIGVLLCCGNADNLSCNSNPFSKQSGRSPNSACRNVVQAKKVYLQIPTLSLHNKIEIRRKKKKHLEARTCRRKS